MVVWIILPIVLSLVSFIGTWSVYGLAFSNKHVCSLSDWEGENFCTGNHSAGCCRVPTISSSGTSTPENSLFTAVINAASFLFLVFCIFHHAHVMEKHTCHSMLSKFALVFGVVASMGAFAAGNCNPGYLSLLHYFGAATSFICICFYTVLLTRLTGKCVLTGYERFLYPFRITSTVIQAIVTLCCTTIPGMAETGRPALPPLLQTKPLGLKFEVMQDRNTVLVNALPPVQADTVLFPQNVYYYVHLAAIFEWMISVNLELFELSYIVEFYFFSSFMLSNLLNKRDEEKPLMMVMP